MKKSEESLKIYSPTLIFNPVKVKKFFDILSRLNRVVENRYKGYFKNNPHISPCEKEVFVNRTLNKWFKDSYFIWWKNSEQTKLQQKVYISISNIKFYLGYSNEIEIYYYDYSKPMDIWNTIKLSYNDCINLEGEFCKNGDLHHQLLKLTVINEPEKEFVFKAWDWTKYPKRKKKGWTNEDIYKSMETTISFKANTLKKAYELKKSFEDKQIEDKKGKIIISDIIEIREIFNN